MIKILVGVVVALAVLAGIGKLAWYWMTGPLYQPGDIRAGKDLTEPLDPPAQTGPRWRVAPDVELYHFEEGEGTPILVVHGGPGFPPLQTWAGGKLLASTYRMIYYHQRGCGESSRPIRSFPSTNTYANMRQAHQKLGFPAQVADIERIRRILGVDRMIVIGHSFGAEIAALWAAEFPERVRALICVAPADLAVLPIPDENKNLFTLARNRMRGNMKQEYDQYVSEYFDFRRAFARNEQESSEFYARFGKYLIAAYGAGPAKVREPGYAPLGIYCSMGAHHDYRGAFAAVKAPVLVIHGANDLQPESTSRSFANRFANHKFVRVENARHFIFDEQPEAFAAAVREFLAQ